MKMKPSCWSNTYDFPFFMEQSVLYMYVQDKKESQMSLDLHEGV